jgi:hypothetical protein
LAEGKVVAAVPAAVAAEVAEHPLLEAAAVEEHHSKRLLALALGETGTFQRS